MSILVQMLAMMSERQHIVFLTEGEIKAIANMYRLANGMFNAESSYVDSLRSSGGESGYEKLLQKVKELNGDVDGK
jgi:hypothetical protein